MVHPACRAAAGTSTRLAISASRWPSSWQPSSRPRPLAGETDVELVGVRVVGRVVVRRAGDGERVQARGGGFVVAEAGAGDREVEDLDDLGSE